MNYDEEYRGFRIAYKRGDRFAQIHHPGDWGILTDIRESKSGDRDAFRAEAHRVIDRQLDDPDLQKA